VEAVGEVRSSTLGEIAYDRARLRDKVFLADSAGVDRLTLTDLFIHVRNAIGALLQNQTTLQQARSVIDTCDILFSHNRTQSHPDSEGRDGAMVKYPGNPEWSASGFPSVLMQPFHSSPFSFHSRSRERPVTGEDPRWKCSQEL